MPGGGSKPGERRGGNVKGSSHKRMMGADQFLALGGYAAVAPQFSAIDNIEKVAKLYLGLAADEQRKGANADRKVMDAHLDKALRALRDLAPYRHARLSSVTVKGDPNAPLNLSGLSDSELAFFRKIMLKLGGGTP